MKYADYVLKEMEISPAELQEGHIYWLNLLKKFDAKKHLLPPDIESTNKFAGGNFEYNIKNISQKYFADKNFNEANFFLAATMIAVAKFSGVKSSFISWVHNGRTTAHELRLMGTLIEQIPIAWDFSEDCTAAKFLDGIEKKTNEGLKYRKSLDIIYNNGLEDNIITFIFQKRLFGFGDGYKIAGTKVDIVDIPNENSTAENCLDIEVNLCGEDEYIIAFDYDNSLYSEKTIKKFAVMIDDIILKLQNENQSVLKILDSDSANG